MIDDDDDILGDTAAISHFTAFALLTVPPPYEFASTASILSRTADVVMMSLHRHSSAFDCRMLDDISASRCKSICSAKSGSAKMTRRRWP